MTCSMPCIVPMNSERAETTKNLTKLRWRAPSAGDDLDIDLKIAGFRGLGPRFRTLGTAARISSAVSARLFFLDPRHGELEERTGHQNTAHEKNHRNQQI